MPNPEWTVVHFRGKRALISRVNRLGEIQGNGRGFMSQFIRRAIEGQLLLEEGEQGLGKDSDTAFALRRLLSRVQAIRTLRDDRGNGTGAEVASQETREIVTKS